MSTLSVSSRAQPWRVPAGRKDLRTVEPGLRCGASSDDTWLAVASDLKIFFGVVGKEPAAVDASDVFAFLAVQRTPRLGERAVRLEDGEAGLAARTIARRLLSVRGLYGYLTARGDTIDSWVVPVMSYQV